MRLLGKLAPGQDCRAGEKRFARVLKADAVREQMMEFKIARFLPVDRTVVFYASKKNPEDGRS